MPSEKNGRVLTIDYFDTQVIVDYGNGRLIIDKTIFMDFPLSLGQTITTTEIQFYEQENKLRLLIDKALKWLKIRDYSTFEMRRKLALTDSPEMVEKAIEKLSQQRWLDDERYLNDFIDRAMREGKGPKRIQLELMDKWNDSTYEIKLSELYPIEKELEVARHLVHKWAPPMTNVGNLKLVKSIQQKLLYRGFSDSVIDEILTPWLPDHSYL